MTIRIGDHVHADWNPKLKGVVAGIHVSTDRRHVVLSLEGVTLGGEVWSGPFYLNEDGAVVDRPVAAPVLPRFDVGDRVIEAATNRFGTVRARSFDHWVTVEFDSADWEHYTEGQTDYSLVLDKKAAQVAQEAETDRLIEQAQASANKLREAIEAAEIASTALAQALRAGPSTPNTEEGQAQRVRNVVAGIVQTTPDPHDLIAIAQGLARHVALKGAGLA